MANTRRKVYHNATVVIKEPVSFMAEIGQTQRTNTPFVTAIEAVLGQGWTANRIEQRLITNRPKRIQDAERRNLLHDHQLSPAMQAVSRRF
jgi:hypothetical protein